MSIQIQVREKVAINLTPEEVIVCGNNGYEVEFLFDDEWASETVKTARFVYRNGGQNYFDEVVFSGNTVKAPVLSNINYVLVGVYAGDLITTTPAVVECDKSILCGSGTHKDPTPDVYNQLVELINKGGATDEKISAAVTAYLVEHPVSGGISATEKNLMLALFKAIPYKSDVSATVKSLEAIWNSSGGDTPDVPDVPAVTYYTIAYNLTNITADNNTASVIEGGSLTVNLTPDTNAVMGEVFVTMGGVDVTATAYSKGKISISSVTGDVVITATAEVANYTQVDYLEGDGTSYIYAPYGIGATDLVEATFYLVRTNWAPVWDSYQNNSVRHSFRMRHDSTAIGLTRRGGCAWSTYNHVTDFTFPAVPCKVKFVETEAGKGTLYDNDGNILYETLQDTEAATFTGTSQIVFLSATTSGTNSLQPQAGMRICELIVKDVYGTVKRHFISVLDENNIPCMYEKVSGEYFYNACTTEGSKLIAGGAV